MVRDSVCCLHIVLSVTCVIINCLMDCVIQISSFGDAGFPLSKHLVFPWSLYVDDEGLIIANDRGNRRLLLLAFNDEQLTHLRDIVSSDVVELPPSFHPWRFCVGNNGKLYVGSGFDAPAETAKATVGFITVWNIHNSPDMDANSTVN